VHRPGRQQRHLHLRRPLEDLPERMIVSARGTLFATLAVAATLHGCSCEQLPSRALTDCNQSAVVQGAVKTDILFVVDDSGSMAPHQTNLANNLSSFINTLKSSPVANDFQIGVTTTSVSNFGSANLVGEHGAFVGPILQGGSATLVADFQAQVAVGTGGSGKEQPLRAMQLALSSPLIDAGQPNAGFLRPGARLAVVLLTDEDDCSDAANPPVIATNTTDGNLQCHNDFGDGVDWKFTRIDPVSGFVGFLRAPIGGEVRDVVVGVIAGLDPTTKAPTCGFAHTFGDNGWGCGSAVNDACAANACGVNSVTNPAAAPNLSMGVYCCGGAGTGTVPCTSTCAAAYDKADRMVAFASALPWNKVVTGSICDASFANTLAQIAGLIVSPTVPLSGEPADPAMLVVRIRRPDGTSVACVSGTDYTYAAASGARPATLTFLDSGACKLDQGYKIEIDVICAG
jgi:hypothetical protein